MARPSPLTYLPLLERALEVEIGIGFEVSGVTREYFKGYLADARKQSGNPALDDLIVFLPAAPYDGEIWICKKEVELDE